MLLGTPRQTSLILLKEGVVGVLDTESWAGQQRYKYWLGSLLFDRSGRVQTAVHDDSRVFLVSYPA